MSRGWDRGGALPDMSSGRLICGSGGGPFKPNVFCGQSFWDDSLPLITLGVNDFSIETWVAPRCYASPNSDVGFQMGFMHDPLLTGFIQITGGIYIQANTWTLTARFNDSGPNITVASTRELLGKWTHVAVNFERAANMTIYFDGIAAGTIAITANNAGDRRFYPFTGGFGGTGVGVWVYDDNTGDIDDWTGYPWAKYLIGPTAAHTRILTMAEIQNSVQGKRVQNFDQPDTSVCYDWRDIERLDGEDIEWEFEELSMQHSLTVGVRGRGVAIPLAAPGTVRVIDQAGAGNHWVLPTRAAYLPAPDWTARGYVAFMYDPFWAT